MSKLKPPVGAADHFQGSENATVTLVEYGDYQCPHCGHAYPIIKAVQKAMGKKLKFVFRNFPLAEAHPNAVHAAIAAEAASGQGKFWEMHDIIFENQGRLGDSHLAAYASKIGLNAKQFEQDFSKEIYRNKVEADFESGVRSGVNGTPSFFINGEKYNESWEADDLLAALESISG
jgi:protein-disulfide isomerase